MITGTLFAIIQGSVKAASQIEEIQRENDSISRLLDALRKTFATLPSAATLQLISAEQSPSEQQELLITGAPNTFGFGPNPISYSATTLSLRPDLDGRVDEAGNPLFSLSLSRDDLIPRTSSNNMALSQELDGVLAQDEQGRNWMPLLRDVSSLVWRFYRVADETWYEEWNRSGWPDLIEVQLLMKGRTTAVRMIFAPPTLALTPGNGTSTTGSSTSSTPAAPAAGAPSGAPQSANPSGSSSRSTPAAPGTVR